MIVWLTLFAYHIAMHRVDRTTTATAPRVTLLSAAWIVAVAASGLGSSACGDNGASGAVTPDAAVEEPRFAPLPCNEADLVATYKQLPNVARAEIESCGRLRVTAQCLRVWVNQPISHAAPGGATFAQQLRVVHRGCERPTVIGDWGYELYPAYYRSEVAQLFDTNEIFVEHRFQGESIPERTAWDWSSLTIANGAADQHALIAGLRRIYQGRWVSTGASKGGITALYHHFLYPDDLDGTVPYVAPASRARIDFEYQNYLAKALPAVCGRAIRDVQLAALTTRRAFVEQKLAALGFEEPADAVEWYVWYFDWGFWQYAGVPNCASVPTAASSNDAFWDFFAEQSGLNFAQRTPAGGRDGLAEPRVATAGGVAPRVDERYSSDALSYEWLTEHGFAEQTNAEVRAVLRNQPSTLEEMFGESQPAVVLPPYDGSLTATLRRWVKQNGPRITLVYGSTDPWSGGMLDEPAQLNSGRFIVANQNHGAGFDELPEPERTAALGLIGSYLNAAPVPATERRRQQEDRQFWRHALRVQQSQAIARMGRTRGALRMRELAPVAP